MTHAHSDEPEMVGGLAQQAAGRLVSTGKSSGNSTSLTSSPNGPAAMTPCNRKEFAVALAHLTAMKRTAELSKIQTEAWHRALGVFDAETINAAILEMALTETRFPEVGDLYQICRRRAIQSGKLKVPYSAHGGQSDSKVPTQAELKEVAARFGLRV